MIQQLRHFLRLDTVEDYILQYSELCDDINLVKSDLAEIVEEFNDYKINHHKQLAYFDTEISKGNSRVKSLKNRIEDRYKSNFITYLGKCKVIKEDLQKSQKDLEFLKSHVPNIEDIYNKSKIEKSYQVVKTAYKNHDITCDVLEKAIKGITKNGKTLYSDCIIKNNLGQILFLLRRSDADFAPSCFGLPGGHIDPFETAEQAAIRECDEETMLKVESVDEIFTFEDDKCIIKYFLCTVSQRLFNPFNDSFTVVLDNNKHQNYQWMDKQDWQDKPLIKNLKTVLDDIFVNDIEKNAIELIQKTIGIEETEELLRKGNKVNHKYIRKEGDKYIYDESKNVTLEELRTEKEKFVKQFDELRAIKKKL
jgi:8-oxo-dGTP pyrophosphatase MutT (NUDIX family)